MKIPSRSIRKELGSIVLALLLLPLVTGCLLRDAHRQISQLDSGCVIAGTAVGDSDQPGPYIVVAWTDLDAEASLRPVDHFVMDEGGPWVFALEPGRYRVLAFRDIQGDLSYRPDNPLKEYRQGEALDCSSGTQLNGIDMVIHDQDRPRRAMTMNLTRERFQQGHIDYAAIASLGQATAYGELTTLSHARFAEDNARDSLWRPLDFFLAGNPGIYFLEPYDAAREPVLFVHGINGSPRVFTELIGQLDSSRFQPWLFYYPSGVGLNENTRYLTNIMLELEIRHGVRRFHVVGHSMGGLVAMAFLQNRHDRGAPAEAGVFLPLSAPWGGHAAAGRAVDASPLVMPVWRDMAPGSDFLANLFGVDNGARLPDSVTMHLLFSYAGGDYLTWGSTDGVISLASLLKPEAQDLAQSVYGFDTTHIGILSHQAAIERINQLLAEAAGQ
ncbi:MAG: alpha/beta hydrolase [Wenzhouxiangella sp.]|nr:MAG: alpha/beta hydrolase [Wenzhouxiangella sp.]